MLKNILFLILGLNVSHQVKGQLSVEVFETGKICPDIVLNDVHQFTETHLSINELRGKPLIIDFFEQHCSICFNSFPKINELQKEFGNRVRFLLIGLDQGGVRDVYGKFQKHFNLELPVAYDSVLFKRFRINQYPFVVWVDDRGIVQATTSSLEIQSEHLQKLISHQSLLGMPQEVSEFKGPTLNYFDLEKPLLMNGNGGDDMDFIYRSVLMKWRHEQGILYGPNFICDDRGKMQGAGMNVFQLYMQAYRDTTDIFYPPLEKDLKSHYGNWFLGPVNETSDSLLFHTDYATGVNLFTYSLLVPGAKSIQDLQKKMRLDLQNYFGYDVRIETRELPYWKVVASDKARKELPTRASKQVDESDLTHLTLCNQPMQKLINRLFFLSTDQIIIDETGIQSNIDLSLSAIMTDFNDVCKVLGEHGLKLVQAKKQMKALVFRDATVK